MPGEPAGAGLVESGGLPEAFRVRVGFGEPVRLEEGLALADELLAEAERPALGRAEEDRLAELVVADGLGDGVPARPDGDGLGVPDGDCSGSQD